MENSVNDPPSPGPNDGSLTQLLTFGENLADSKKTASSLVIDTGLNVDNPCSKTDMAKSKSSLVTLEPFFAVSYTHLTLPTKA